MWINTFSVFDLIAVVLLTGMSMAMLYRYLRVTKRAEEGLLVIVLFLALTYCFLSLAVDNVVPSGTPAATIHNGAERALFLYRLCYVAGTFLLLSFGHFGLRYCQSKHLPGWRAIWLYMGGLPFCLLFWSDSFLRAAAKPRNFTSSWECATPWQPHCGKLFPIFLLLWVPVNLKLQYLFWSRSQGKEQEKLDNFGSRIVWSGITFWSVGGAIGMILAARGYAGVDVTPPIAAASMFVLAFGLGEEYTQHERERVHVTRRFKSYVDPALVKYVIDHPEHERFDGEVREMTVVFTDLDGFTPLSERLREGVVPLLNEYLKVMAPLIREHNGYRNKWLGDGMMFFYGAPEKNPDHAIHAVATVLKMQEMMLTLSDSLAKQKSYLGVELLPLGMRTGVSSGRMIVGDAGPEDASDYTAIGASVNLGARLESANKTMGTRILLSEHTVKLLPPDLFLVRPIGKLKLIGIARAEMAYEPIAHLTQASGLQKRCAELSIRMVEFFCKADFHGCLAAEEQMALEIGPSKVGQVYRQLCGDYLLVAPQLGFAGEIILPSK